MNKLVDCTPGDELADQPGGVIEYYSTRIDSEFVNAVIDRLRQNAITISRGCEKACDFGGSVFSRFCPTKKSGTIPILNWEKLKGEKIG